jgi:hypothetical protein
VLVDAGDIRLALDGHAFPSRFLMTRRAPPA